MPNAVDKSSSNHASALSQWVAQTLNSRGIRAKFRLRGNSLHILCQATPCPERMPTLLWMIKTLQHTNPNTLLPATHSPIYRVQLYGSQPGATRPEWNAVIHLNQLDRHLEQLQQGKRSAGSRSTKLAFQDTDKENTALALSNRSLAKQGQEIAIASYLSETLSNLGIAVQVSAKTVPYTPPATVQSGATPLAAMTTKRLWVACGAAYSPDPSLVSEPITRRLRELEIAGYRDAVILFQVTGETQPDWKLRVDLTPPGEMLREWGRWGDVEAIQRLLNQAGEAQGLQVTTAALKESTLHLFCSTCLPATRAPDQAQAQQWVADFLETLAPQGIQAAMLYGQAKDVEPPVWVEWLQLPAALHPALAEPALTLAQQSDWEAIAFLLHRLLNPSLDRYLTTGGIRLQLLPKQDLLHVMSEAVICPEQHWVGQTIAKFLRQLKLSQLTGVRIYGRRAGQKLPLWSFGLDFVTRARLVPEAAPEFVATAAFVQELVTPFGEPSLRPDLTPADIQSVWRKLCQQMVNGIERTLVRSGLFSPNPETQALAMSAPSPSNRPQSFKLSAVWGTVGVLLVVQTNWLLGQVLSAKPTSPELQRSAVPTDVTAPVLSSTLPTETSDLPAPKPVLRKSPKADGVFNTEGFTQSGAARQAPAAGTLEAPASRVKSRLAVSTSLPYTPLKPESDQITASILAAAPTLATFNSRQLDDKLKLYYQYLKEKGSPPDVLIIGSSRALRGVDPIALKQALSNLGYQNVSIFNFGINGATAQVADLVVEQLLTPEQLPRLILWADGARAFNSGTNDVTYNGIAASEGYRQLIAGQFPVPKLTASTSEPPANSIPKTGGINLSLTSSYKSLDRWLSDRLASVSGIYGDRDRLKHLFQEQFSQVWPTQASSNSPQTASASLSGLQASQPVTPEGFLSLAVQFNPATYYQKYAKVTGEYDSDYEDFKIAGRQQTSLQSLLQFTQTRKIPVVFVNLPLTEDYLDPARHQHEQEFKEYMVALSMKQPGFTFRDLSELWTTKYGYFSDPSHLNRYGAYAVAHQLAQDPLIPWTGAGKN
ncbi:MAG TPA: DUF1574 domain-containing protein [Coleofasciculaceae cyanobacterium]